MVAWLHFLSGALFALCVAFVASSWGLQKAKAMERRNSLERFVKETPLSADAVRIEEALVAYYSLQSAIENDCCRRNEMRDTLSIYMFAVGVALELLAVFIYLINTHF